MLTGEAARVMWAHTGASKPQEAVDSEAETYLWWTQEFAGAEIFECWIGTPEATWSRLGSAMASDASGAKQIFLEMLSQAQRGQATLLSGHSGKQIRCGDGQTAEAFAGESFSVAEIRISIGGADLPPLLYAIDPAVAILMDDSDALSPKSNRSGAVHKESGYGPMLEKMLDLELPLSVVLGRAVMPIQEVLKVTSGSLIPLNQSVGEYVELMIHGKVVARGEVMSFRGNYGIRIKEIMSPEGRMALSSDG